MAEERLQKIIAAAGVASRRQAEKLIVAGRVTVNGRPVTELGAKADPRTDRIAVDGRLLSAAGKRRYLLLNKPVGYLCTMADPAGRPIVSELLTGVRERVYPVGRLDYLSAGLLLCT
ncbi:MAG: rRNA pseudouridine synthase, partial [Deltaproteobacteria bacterium]|nr:rRNA pseudouridine synthase [Deltaproteobacteria bacterium]